jgi:hypothetical protein
MSCRCLPLLLVCWSSLAVPLAHADMITQIATAFTGDPAQVQVTLRDGANVTLAGSVAIDLKVVGPQADLRGLFLNTLDESLLPGLLISGTNVTSVVKSANSVTDLGGGANIHPEGPFDIGIELGTPGIGKDDLSSVTVTLKSPVRALKIADFFTVPDPVTPAGSHALLLAVRVTSVLVGRERSGSSKLGIDAPSGNTGGITSVPVHAPEPTALALLAFGGVLAVGWPRKRRDPSVGEEQPST